MNGTSAKTIPQAFLDTLRDLIVRNRYEIPDDTPPSVVDAVLERAYWPIEIGGILRSTVVNQVALADRLDAWLRPYRVRKRTFASGTQVHLGQTTDAGALIDLADGTFLRNYFVVVAGPNVAVNALPSVDLAFNPDADPEEHFPHGSLLERWVLTNTPEIVAVATEVFEEWQAAPGRNVVLAQTPLASTGAIDLGPFPVEVEVYVAFPRTGTILYPEWFLQGWTEVGDVFLLDRARRIGGDAGGPSVDIRSGGGSGVLGLPHFLRPLIDMDEIRFDVPAQEEAIPWVSLVAGTSIAQIDGLRWSPANDRGSLGLAFDRVDGLPALVATMEFDVSDARVTLIDGPDLSFESVRITASLRAEVRDGRIFWDLRVEPAVQLELGIAPGLFVDRIDKVEAQLAETLRSAVEDAIDPVLVETVACVLFAVPMLRVEPDVPAADLQPATTFGEWMENIADVTTLLLQLTNIGGASDGFLRTPDYPTSALPSSLHGAIADGTLQRVLDRFVEYRSITLEPDPDAAGHQRLVVDYELLDAHADGGGRGYSHEVVPRETYVLRPVEVRLLDHEKRWVDYATLQLEDVLRALGGSPYLIRKYAPRLHLDVMLRVEHDSLPGSPIIRELVTSEPLVETDVAAGNVLHHHYETTRLRPPLDTSRHLLELPSTLDTPGGEIVHNGRLAISGTARLSFWSDGDAPQGCARVLTEILARAAESFRRRQARPGSPDPVAESPDQLQGSEASFTALHDEVVLDLGTFSLDPALSLTDQTGLSLVANGVDNLVTARGTGVEVDFVLERTSVPTELLDWIEASFLGLRLAVDEKGTSPVNQTLDRIVDRQPFQIVAKVNGTEIASASFRLDGGPWHPSTPVTTSQTIPLRGEQWSRELYIPKDLQTLLTVRLEARRGTQVLAAAERTIPRIDPGMQWHEAAEWGIPQGHDRVLLTLGSAQGGLEVECRLRNRAFDPGSVPLEHRPKTYEFSAEEILVRRDRDPFGAGELKYWVALSRKVEGEEAFVDAVARTWTRVHEASSGDTIDPDLPPRTGPFKPGDTAGIGAGGREIDNPNFPFFDPHDWLEKGWEERTVVGDDSEDGPLEIDTADFRLSGTWRNRSRPPRPELSVLDPEDNKFVSDNLTVTDPTTPLTLRIRAAWLDSLELFTFVLDGGDLDELPATRTALPAPAPTDSYQPPLTGDFTEGPEADQSHFTYYMTLVLSANLPIELQLLARNSAGVTAGNKVRLRAPTP
jgi:hypothetical protein